MVSGARAFACHAAAPRRSALAMSASCFDVAVQVASAPQRYRQPARCSARSRGPRRDLFGRASVRVSRVSGKVREL